MQGSTFSVGKFEGCCKALVAPDISVQVEDRRDLLKVGHCKTTQHNAFPSLDYIRLIMEVLKKKYSQLMTLVFCMREIKPGPLSEWDCKPPEA